MSPDVLTQVRSYYQSIDERQEPIRPEEVEALVESIDALAARRRRRRPGPQLWIAVAAAVALLVGLSTWLFSRADEPDTIVDQPTTTTTPNRPDDGFGTARGPLGPGRWSVAATIAEADADRLESVITDLRTWAGVVEVVEIAGTDDWMSTTGLDPSGCETDAPGPPCGPGLAALVVDADMFQVALRLESDHDMVAITATQVADDFVAGYVDAALRNPSSPLDFDPSSLGTEIPLTGPLAAVTGPECGQWCLRFGEGESSPEGIVDAMVEVDVDGVPFRAGLSREAAVEAERSGYLLMVGSADRFELGGRSLDAERMLVDDDGRGSVLAELKLFTDIDSPLGARRVYVLAGLPLDAAIVAMDLADGTSVWQRPRAGMALIVDGPDSLPPDHFVFHPDEDDEGFTDTPQSNPIRVLDRLGDDIIAILDTEDDEPEVRDLRVDPASGQESSAVPLEVAQVLEVGGPVPDSVWGASRVIAVDDEVWIGTLDWGDEASGTLTRISSSTRETSSLELPGGVADLIATSDFVYALVGDGNIIRVERSTMNRSEPIPAGTEEGHRDLTVVGDDLWVAGGSTMTRIPLDGGTPERIEADDSIQPGIAGGSWTANNRVDMWLGETRDALWALGSHDAIMIRVDPTTDEVTEWELVETHGVIGTHESTAVLADQDIWIMPIDDAPLIRFDTRSASVDLVPYPGGWGGELIGGDLWVVSDDGGVVSRVDTSTGRLAAVVNLGGNADGPSSIVGAGDGSIWVSAGTTLSRVDVDAGTVTHRAEIGAAGQIVAVAGEIWVVGEDGIITIVPMPA